MAARKDDAAQLQKEWAENPRWKGVTRPYEAAEVIRLRGSVHDRAQPGKSWARKSSGARSIPKTSSARSAR